MVVVVVEIQRRDAIAYDEWRKSITKPKQKGKPYATENGGRVEKGGRNEGIGEEEQWSPPLSPLPSK